MSMSSNCVELDPVVPPPVRSLIYHDMACPPAPSEGRGLVRAEQSEEAGRRRQAEVELSHEEFANRIATERSGAIQEAEQRLRSEYEQKLEAERAPVVAAVLAFETRRDEYFSRAETEIVQLALAIAAKILHREAQVDPMLVATLVRMAVEKMREGSNVTVRVGAREVVRWKHAFATLTAEGHVQVVEDGSLSDHDCLVETELGVANFGLDTQLKEVEQGFFDLMALRPAKG
jgi:flagellar assembly protein FliH